MFSFLSLSLHFTLVIIILNLAEERRGWNFPLPSRLLLLLLLPLPLLTDSHQASSSQAIFIMLMPECSTLAQLFSSYTLLFLINCIVIIIKYLRCCLVLHIWSLLIIAIMPTAWDSRRATMHTNAFARVKHLNTDIFASETETERKRERVCGCRKSFCNLAF